jgi:exodeoxyribonuclease V beta subunit
MVISLFQYAPAPFDPTVPLPEGVTSLEASAGTGKTHAVASLVVTEVARGRPIDELLVVTFTRKATSTLRERVWRQLADAYSALATDAPPTSDLVHTYLREGSTEEVARRRANLASALSNYDAATIATTHGFCQQVLTGLGVAGDAERDLELSEDVSSLVEEAIDDLFVRRFHTGGDVLFSRTDADRIARAVIDNPDADIAPVDMNSEAARLRQRFATTLRKRIHDQKRRSRLVTYDDLLDRLAASIEDPVRGEMVADRLRRRYSMAIVDEFQDTDTVQWRILRAAFGAPPSRLVLVGDPKQAIYAFRGGDVHAYLQATDGATRFGLPVSWRSDQPLLDGLDTFFGGAQLGGPTILHRPLVARPGAEERRLLGATLDAPITVRIADRRDERIVRTPQGGYAQKASARRVIAADVAAEAVRILSLDTRIIERGADGTPDEGRLVEPGDLAVLVRRHADAETARDSLLGAGVPAIVHGGASVLKSESAGAWLNLLRALEQPASTLRVRAVANGPFVGWEATRLATASEEDWDGVDERLRDWGAAFQTAGVAGLMRRVETTADLTARLLATAGGERIVSDLYHLAELLHAQQSSHPGSVALLARWLSEQRANDVDTDATRRRLESDAGAVAIHTIHGAKGLEFPIVLLPSLWEAAWINQDDPPLFHDDSGQRCIGVGGGGPLHDAHRAAAEHEQAEEELRLLYVALTRASRQVVLWWATANDARSSPFARVLLGKDSDTGAIQDRLQKVPSEDQIRDALTTLASRCDGAIDIVDVGPPVQNRLRARQVTEPSLELSVCSFERDFDHLWTRTSYSGLTAAAHDAGVALTETGELVEIDERTKTDEPELVDVSVTADTADAPTPLPLADLPGGARFGTLVHEVLERTDFCSDDLAGALHRATSALGARRLLEGRADELVLGLETAIDTPLGPLFDGLRLRDIAPSDRLDELTFDLPLAGGDSPRGTVTMDAVASVFTRLPGTDPFAGYHEQLRDPLLETTVRGFLTGTIDVVTRVGPRHVVIDYKSNRLAPAGEVPTSWHFRPDGLRDAMIEAHYPLQAALYMVALHRYLRWRIGGYDPGRHLGGAAYLFLRGMTGSPEAGVFSWAPPPSFVIDLSDLLDTGAAP